MGRGGGNVDGRRGCSVDGRRGCSVDGRGGGSVDGEGRLKCRWKGDCSVDREGSLQCRQGGGSTGVMGFSLGSVVLPTPGVCGLYQPLTASPGSCPSTASDPMGSWGRHDRSTYYSPGSTL